MNVNVEKGLSRFALENKLNIDRTFILSQDSWLTLLPLYIVSLLKLNVKTTQRGSRKRPGTRQSL